MIRRFYFYLLVVGLVCNHYSLAQTAAGSSSDLDAIDLNKINRPVLQNKQLEINPPRRPHFLFQDGDGTEIIEYREPNHPNSIEVRSGLGTSYQLTQPENGDLQMHNNNLPLLPTINLFEF